MSDKFSTIKKNIFDIVELMNIIKNSIDNWEEIYKLLFDIMEKDKKKILADTTISENIEKIKNILKSHFKWKDMEKYIEDIILYLNYLFHEKITLQYPQQIYDSKEIDIDFDTGTNIEGKIYKCKNAEEPGISWINFDYIGTPENINQDSLKKILNKDDKYIFDEKDNKYIYEKIIKKVNKEGEENIDISKNKMIFKTVSGIKYCLAYKKEKTPIKNEILDLEKYISSERIRGLRRKVYIILFYFRMIKKCEFHSPNFYVFDTFPENKYGIIWRHLGKSKYSSNIVTILNETIEGERIIASESMKKIKKENIKIKRNEIFNNDIILSGNIKKVSEYINAIFEERKKKESQSYVSKIFEIIEKIKMKKEIILKLKNIIKLQGDINYKNVKYIEKILSLAAWNAGDVDLVPYF
jgi:hypothetical protein